MPNVAQVLAANSPFDYSKHGTVQLYAEPQPEPDTYTEEEYGRLVREADRVADILIRDMMVVFANTGMRFGELAHLTPDWLRWNSEPPHIDIRARNGWKPKDPWEQKKVPMTEAVAEIMKRRGAAANGGLLFPNEAGHVIDGRRSLERLKMLFPAAGIVAVRRLHRHSWRNHFVIWCLDNGRLPHHIHAVDGARHGHDGAALRQDEDERPVRIRRVCEAAASGKIRGRSKICVVTRW